MKGLGSKKTFCKVANLFIHVSLRAQNSHLRGLTTNELKYLRGNDEG